MSEELIDYAHTHRLRRFREHPGKHYVISGSGKEIDETFYSSANEASDEVHRLKDSGLPAIMGEVPTNIIDVESTRVPPITDEVKSDIVRQFRFAASRHND
jgi:hypothetical protein